MRLAVRIFILLTIPMLLLQSDSYSSTEFPEPPREEPPEVIRWTMDTEGNITTDRYHIDSYGEYSRSMRDIDIGYADGEGNIYIQFFFVLRNQTLIIDPGVSVHCIGEDNDLDLLSKNPPFHRYLNIAGNLYAEGTSEDPITFTRKKSQGYEYPSWLNDFHIVQELSGSDMVFKHCIMNYTQIKANYQIDIQNCVSDNWLNMIAGSYFASEQGKDQGFIVKNCHFHGDNYIMYPSSAIIEGNEFITRDVSSFTGGNIHLINNDFINGSVTLKNDYNGLLISQNDFKESEVLIGGNLNISSNLFDNCSIWPDDESTELILFRNSIISSSFTYITFEEKNTTVDARYNYWGTTDRFEIERMVEDERLEVLFEPYLDENMRVYHQVPEEEKDEKKVPLEEFIAFIILWIGIVIFFLVLWIKKRIR